MAGKVKGLQEWCKRQCEGYRDVSITNMTSSWKSGLAFCAIIHRYRPDLIDYDSLSKENVYENNKLAFTVGETIGIPALLDAEDMVAMAVPDKLCIITYVAQYYNVFRDKSPGGGPGKPSHAIKRPSGGAPSSRPPETKRPTPKQIQTQEETSSEPQKSTTALNRRGTYGENCHMCGGKVYLLERHIDTGTLYHRHCFRTSQRAQQKPSTYTSNLHSDNSGGQDNGRKTAGIFETQNKNRMARGLKATPVGGIDKSLSAGVTSQDTHAPSHARSHPYSRQPPTENKIDKIAELFKDTEKPVENTTSSKNLLLAGYTSSAYKPIAVDASSVFSGTRSYTPDSTPGHTTVSSSETKPRITTITSKSATSASGRHAEEIDTKSKLNVSQSADVRHAANTRTPKAQESTSVSGKGKASDKSVVSGLLQNLAQVRNNDSKDTATSSATSYKTTSNISVTGGNQVKVVSHATVNNKDGLSQNVSKSAANARNPINPKRKYLQIKKQEDVPKTSTVVTSPSSITQSPISSRTTKVTTKVSTTTIHTNVVKPNIPQTNTTNTSSSITSTTLHSKSSRDTNAQDTKPNKTVYTTTMIETPVKQPRSILKIRAAEPEKLSDDELEIDWTTPDPTLKTKTQGAPTKSALIKSEETNGFPVAPPRKSILKKRDDAKHLEINTTNKPNSARNDISAFNLKDSVEMSHGVLGPTGARNKRNEMQKVEIEIKGKKENDKPEWMVEAEKRRKMRGGKYIDPEKTWKTDVKTSEVTSKSNSTSENITKQTTGGKQIDTTGKTRKEKQHEKPSDNSDKYKSSVIQTKQNKEKAKLDAIDEKQTSDSKPSWMKEAERRIIERNGQYIDPEKNPQRKHDVHDGRSLSPTSPPPRPSTSPTISPTISPSPRSVSPQSPGQQNGHRSSPTARLNGARGDILAGRSLSPASPPPRPAMSPAMSPATSPAPSPSRQNGHVSSPTAGLNAARSPKRRAPPRPDHLPPYTKPPTYESITSPGRRVIPGPLPISSPLNSPEERRPLKKIEVDHDFQFSSFEASTDWDAVNLNSPGQRSPIYYPPDRESPVPPPVPPKNLDEEDLSPYSYRVKQIQDRPLPPPPLRSPGCNGCNATKRTVQAENRLSFTDMEIQLEELDKQLQILEGEGRILEDKIRSDTDDGMNENELMAEWFELVNAKNDLVRKEADLMYKQRQQELEVLHEELEYDLRCLMNKPDRQKTASEKVREQALLQELLDTVSQRNLIVDSMEEDRIRYIEEDEEIANVMAAKGFTKDPPKKNGKRKKNKKDKKKKS